jgi:hypothetical protein
VDLPADLLVPILLADLGPTFNEFWAAYGKKQDKHKSSLRWKCLTPPERRSALAATPAYVAATPDKKYRKNPLTWLNGKCWQDEEQPVQQSAGQPMPTVPRVGATISIEPELNSEVVAERQARQEAELAANRRRHRESQAVPTSS